MKLSDIEKLDAKFSVRFHIPEEKVIVRRISAFFAHSGDSWFWLAGLTILWFWGSPFWHMWAEKLAWGILITACVVMIIKLTVRRKRPEGNWGAIYRKSDPHSFPSGHAARAIMLVILTFLLGPSWLAFILLIWAPLVGIARVALGVHFFGDILVGMVLGVFVAVGLIPWL